ncbi:MAG: hypothetical protein A2V88_02835 [Elusimicrobia bacterium RBG_16_66_12]|nr:MAG: hypothetical protein A2V88_02835 [Elusimicrobia bacterium RBG_16_66_12]
MKAMLLLFLPALPCAAAPGALDFQRLAAAAGSPGFVLPQVSIPLTRAVPSAAEEDTARVDLAPLLDRHLSLADSFTDRVGRHLVAVTLDQTEPDGAWLTVTPPGAQPLMVLIGAGMKGQWSAGGRSYTIDLDINIFRARLNNIIRIRDADTDEVLWSRRIIEIMSTSYFAGQAVRIGGRPYRLFLGRMPDESRRPAVASDVLGVCLIYDETLGGKHVKFQTFRVFFAALQRPDGVMMRLVDGDRARLTVSPDGAFLDISR